MTETVWPAEDLERVETCPVCGSGDRHELYRDLEDRVSWTAPGRWTLQACEGCGSAFLDPRPTRETIGRAYAEYYTHGDPDPPPQDALAFSNSRQALANGYVNAAYGYDFAPASALGMLVARVFPRRRWLADMNVRHLDAPTPGARLLDVGCGNGEFLLRMRAAGWEVEGVEPDEAAVRRARPEGLVVHQGTLTDVDLPESHFDAVTLSHVVEHLHDPAENLAVCRRLLRPGGRVWIATPNLDSFGHRAFGRSWRGLEPPRHLVIFTRRSLVQLLRQAGFEVVSLPRTHAARFLFPASEAIVAGEDWQTAPGSLSVRLRGHVADLTTRFRPERAEETVVIARKPG